MITLVVPVNHQTNVIGRHWWWVSIGSGSGLLTSKSLPDPKFTQIYIAIWSLNIFQRSHKTFYCGILLRFRKHKNGLRCFQSHNVSNHWQIEYLFNSLFHRCIPSHRPSYLEACPGLDVIMSHTYLQLGKFWSPRLFDCRLRCTQFSHYFIESKMGGAYTILWCARVREVGWQM